jgi:hypothetical protein
MGTIYIVTAGEYSDYHVVSVFDSRDKAESFVEYYNDNDNWSEAGIEEYELNEHADQVQKGYNYYFVRMQMDGNTKEICKDTPSNIDNFLSRDLNNNIIDHVWAKDEEHAIKIVNERRIQEKAEA